MINCFLTQAKTNKTSSTPWTLWHMLLRISGKKFLSISISLMHQINALVCITIQCARKRKGQREGSNRTRNPTGKVDVVFIILSMSSRGMSINSNQSINLLCETPLALICKFYRDRRIPTNSAV